jgi:hypothetical protein
MLPGLDETGDILDRSIELAVEETEFILGDERGSLAAPTIGLDPGKRDAVEEGLRQNMILKKPFVNFG